MLRSACHLMKRKMSTSSFNPLSPHITLTPLERNITGLLKDFCAHYNEKNPGKELLEPRITGGWVRDKLLGQASHDLDIAVNVMSGQEFAEGLLEYVKEHPPVEADGESITGGHIHTIEKNPEKSKHLETATTKLYGLDIDFVNLRNEEYTEDSRIPQIEFGTPEEDALRRDATLNALFYNIQQDKIEDLTQRGLQDLKDGILRTPLEPRKTFLDDPLRVLRLVRFASRFGFEVEKETFDAMKGEEVKRTLLEKISRERVGVEIGKTLDSDAITGLGLLSQAKLIGVVFGFGTMDKDVKEFNDVQLINETELEVEESIDRSLAAIKSLSYQGKLAPVISGVLRGDSIKRQFWISTVLNPWAGIKVAINKKKRLMSAAEAICREGLKCSRLEAEMVSNILSTKEEFQTIVAKLPEYKRSEVGFLLRNYDAQYRLAFVFNLMDEVVKSGECVIAKYEEFWDVIENEHLQEVYKLRHLADGKMISKKLERKPGPWMTPLMTKVMQWQLDNPDKGVEECLKYVKSVLDK